MRTLAYDVFFTEGVVSAMNELVEDCKIGEEKC